jgi:hypothetical protein
MTLAKAPVASAFEVKQDKDKDKDKESFSMSQSDQCFDKYFVLANVSKLLGIKRYTLFRQADRNHTFWPFWLAFACVKSFFS